MVAAAARGMRLAHAGSCVFFGSWTTILHSNGNVEEVKDAQMGRHGDDKPS
jgi:hypothetical protein